ncbi:MAG: hypothetical protein HY040_23340 [Planctomycetes bacterium]|nr:hypothetical protein [Planctomycetota bacterium]
MDLAYPQGPATIIPNRLPYYDLPADKPLTEILPPAPLADGIVQTIASEDQAVQGYAFRLGSATFPHLKLRAQQMDHCGQATWVFMVDTHDAFSKDNPVPPPEHPDCPRWLALQNANRHLKERIEAAWAEHDLATVNSILREDLR